MKDYVNWAILAPGSIANSMAAAMNGSQGKIKLYAVGSRNIDRAKEFATKWGFEKCYGSYEELLNDPNVDAVYVANPHAFHFGAVMQCLEHNKHVLCEKPAGCNFWQLDKMIKTAKEKNLFFMEAMWTAFNPCVNKIKEIISQGKIGKLKHIESRFCNRIPFDKNNRLWAPELAGGALLDLGIYNIFFAYFLNNFEPILHFNSNVRMENDVDAWNCVNIAFTNGVTTSFQSACDMPAASNTHDAVIFGTEGYITTQNFFMSQEAQIHKYKSEWGNDNEVVEIINFPFDVNGYEYELREATECILQGKTECEKFPFVQSEMPCKTMDALRASWNFVYPFECCKN